MARHHAFVTLLGAALAAACSLARSESGKLMLPTVQVQAQSQVAVMEWDGVIQAVRQSTVAAQVPGNITALLVKAGDSVKAGQALARIDDRDTQAALTRSQADVAQADAQLTNARQQLGAQPSTQGPGLRQRCRTGQRAGAMARRPGRRERGQGRAGPGGADQRFHYPGGAV